MILKWPIIRFQLPTGLNEYQIKSLQRNVVVVVIEVMAAFSLCNIEMILVVVVKLC